MTEKSTGDIWCVLRLGLRPGCEFHAGPVLTMRIHLGNRRCATGLRGQLQALDRI